MALGFANLPNGLINSGTDATSYASASWTPPTSGAILVWIFSAEANGLNEVASVSGNGLTWVKIGQCGWAPSTLTRRTTLFAAWASGATTGVTTVDFGANTQLGCIAIFTQVTGTFGPSNIRDIFPQGASYRGNDVSGSFNFPNQEASSASRAIACFAHLANETTTERTNWTELEDQSGAGPLRGVEVQVRTDAWEATASATWTTSSLWAGFGVEISESGAGTPSGGDGTIDGVMPESNSYLGPFVDSNENIYTIIEVAAIPADDQASIRKSSDGSNWIEIDGMNRPGKNDIEGLWAVQAGTQIHAIWQASGGEVTYHAFNTSDAGSDPDRWAIYDDVVVAATSPTEQAVSLARISDGSLYAFYGKGSSPQVIGYKKRSGGSWGSENTITVATKSLTQVVTVVDSSDIIHIFVFNFTDKEVLYYDITSDVLSGPTTVAGTANTHQTLEAPMVVPPVLTSSGVYIAWENNSAILLGCEVIGGTPGSIQTISDAAVRDNPSATQLHGPVATLGEDGTDQFVIYADNVTEDGWMDTRSGGAWGTDAEIHDAVTYWYAWGSVYERDGKIVFGYIWADGADLRGANNDAMPHYREEVLEVLTPPTEKQTSYYFRRRVIGGR